MDRYLEMSTDELLALFEQVRAAIESGEECDNYAPGTCCDECNVHEIVDQLERRGVVTNWYA